LITAVAKGGFGVAVGVAVGATVGVAVGVAVGAVVGVAVGFAVAVAAGVGEAVAAGVAVAEGTGVALSDGVGVLAAVVADGALGYKLEDPVQAASTVTIAATPRGMRTRVAIDTLFRKR
jgi:hypothetical protein